MQEREAEFEAEQERIRWEKEKETARLRAMQERAQDLQAEQVSGLLTRHLLLRWLARHLPHHHPSEAGCGGSMGLCRPGPAPGAMMSWSSAGHGAGRGKTTVKCFHTPTGGVLP